MRGLVAATLATVVVASSACGGKSHAEHSDPRVVPSAGAGAGPTTPGAGGALDGAGGSAGSSGAALTGTGGALGAPRGGNAGSPNLGGTENGGSTGGSGASGATGGLAQANAGASAADTGGISGGTTGDAGSGNSAGEGQAGEPSCVESNGTCACNWLTAVCDDRSSIYVGKECPPTFDEARRVASWPLTGPDGRWRNGYYEECDNGTRVFWYSFCNESETFIFDAQGRLANWTEDNQFCVSRVCDTDTTSTTGCVTCEMRPDPPAEGLSCFPRGQNNGPTTSCSVDSQGRWVMPPLCDN